MRIILVLVIGLALVSPAYPTTSYIEDDDAIIEVETEDGDVKTITHGDGRQTWIWDNSDSGNVDIVHPDGTTTHVFDGKYVR